MTRFGTAGLVGLETEFEGGIRSYMRQVAEGQRRDGALPRLSHLARANYAHNYINWLRKRSNETAYLNRAATIERRLVQPWHRQPALTERADKYAKLDYYVERGAIPRDQIAGLRAALFDQPAYFDPYAPGFEFRGRPDQTEHPFLSMDSQALFTDPHFLAIAANPQIIAFCREVLGPAAALSWSWAWITNPGTIDYQNQNWHRDCSEPLNYVRIFVPLNDIVALEDGPTALIPGSSRLSEFREVRRFSNEELADVQAQLGAGMVQADVGDVYFINTMALHRAITPHKRRGMLSLLVSLSPSHRTPSIVRQKLADLPEPVRGTVRANRRFFRYLVA